MEEEAGGNIRQRENRHSTESGDENLQKRVDELEKVRTYSELLFFASTEA